MQFTIESTYKNARRGVLQTHHSTLQTPAYAIVATKADLKCIPKELWKELPIDYLIVNTFHIAQQKSNMPSEKPDQIILEKVSGMGGIHSYMDLKDRTIASDSGGYQVFSLGFGKSHKVGKFSKAFHKDKSIGADDDNPVDISEEGAEFVYDGKKQLLTPERSMDIQHRIGADIIFAFDECTSPLNSKAYVRASMERTHRWLDRCISAHKGYESKESLFGIVQGSSFLDLRRESAEFMAQQEVPGFGIGGSFGNNKQDMVAMLHSVNAILPAEKPRHFLGIGTVVDVFLGVEQGIDLFDCVIPTREARHRILYSHAKGKLILRKVKHLDEVIDPECQCTTCTTGVSTRQMWELFKNRDKRGPMYASIHNIQFFADLMRKIRESIENKSFQALKNEVLQKNW